MGGHKGQASHIVNNLLLKNSGPSAIDIKKIKDLTTFLQSKDTPVDPIS